MNMVLMITGILFVLVYGVVRRGRENHFVGGDDKKDTTDSSDFIEMEDVFFEKIQGGLSEVKFLNIYSQYDLMLIKSLFQSEGIPYRSEFEHMSKLKSGIHMDSQNNVYVYILEEDIEDATKVVEYYLQSKQIDNNDKNENLHKIRNVSEFIIGGWAAPSPQYYKGIEILVQGHK